MVLTGIVATVLLANGRRNLKLLMDAVGMPIEQTMTIPKPGTVRSLKGGRLKGVAVNLPAHTFDAIELEGLGAFLRDMRIEGEEVCSKLRLAGFPVSGWEVSGFAKTIRECFYEKTWDNPADPASPSSFFLMVKGTPGGALHSIRIKMIIADPALRREMIDWTDKILVLFADLTGLPGVDEARMRVKTLSKFQMDDFGVDMRFAPEAADPNRFNLVVVRSARAKVQKRTDAFFDRSNYLPLPREYHAQAAIAEIEQDDSAPKPAVK
jgi:hypothetical protein